MSGFEHLGLVLSVATAVSTALNVYLTLRLRVEILEGEKRILRTVHDEYCPREVCIEKMERLEAAFGARHV